MLHITGNVFDCIKMNNKKTFEMTLIWCILNHYKNQLSHNDKKNKNPVAWAEEPGRHKLEDANWRLPSECLQTLSPFPPGQNPPPMGGGEVNGQKGVGAATWGTKCPGQQNQKARCQGVSVEAHRWRRPRHLELWAWRRDYSWETAAFQIKAKQHRITQAVLRDSDVYAF